MKNIFTTTLLLLSFIANAQVFINEIDADTVGSDALEFVELKSTIPNFSLNGYVLVFFNGTSAGTGNLSYFAIDLDGKTTDVNGNFLIGNASVSPTPSIIIPNNTIQNGPDAVAIYQANGSDFMNNTTATNANLVNALAYANGNLIVASSLMSIFGLSQSQNEADGINVDVFSIQRKNDGTYEVKLPTPGVNNDGTGIVFNYLSFSQNNTTITEGQNLVLNFATTQVVTGTPLIINFTINNGTFTSADYTGNLSTTIPVGETTATATIQILNDNLNDGDEEAKIVVTNLPTQYALNNNNQIIRIKNINFVVLPFGNPANPTQGNITSTAPAGYYNSLNGLSGVALKQAVQNIIANPAIVKAFSYADVYEMITIADQNPSNSNEVWLLYTETPRSKLDIQSGNSIVGKWNREHIYPQSRGNYASGLDYDLPPFGINNGLPTDANDIGAGLSDAHHIRAVDGQENSSRNNKDFGLGDYNGPSGSTANTWKGDVARSLFYMATRYNGLSLVNGNPLDSTISQLGDLATLLQWNTLDPSDDFEMNRNNYIFTWQKNRNPFIDLPNLANYIFGSNFGQVWNANLTATNFNIDKIVFYPNPAKTYFEVSGLEETSKLEIYNILGEKILDQTIENNSKIETNWNSGIYFAKVTSGEKSISKKIIVN
jgi:hypothetical protein